jgi:quinol monooxygenase YgiN
MTDTSNSVLTIEPRDADHPPRVAAPPGAPAVMVTLRLTARDAEAFAAHLRAVLPVTRTASGCRFSHTYQAPDQPAEVLLVQGWDSLAQQQTYLAWRERRGDLARFQAHLTKPPVVESFVQLDA